MAQTASFGEAANALEYLSDQLKAFAQDMKTHVAGMQQMASTFAQSIRGLVTAGFAGTQEAQRLSLAWTLLSRQVASIFVPVVNQLTLAIHNLTRVFAGLSGHGQAMALAYSAVAGAIATKLPLMSLLSAAFGVIRTALSPLTLMLGALVTGLMDFLTGTQEGQAILSGISQVMQVFGAVFKVVGEAIAVVADAVVVAFQGIYRGMNWVVIKIAGIIEAILDWVPGLGDAAESVKKFKENAQASLDSAMASGWGAKKSTEAKRNSVTPANMRFEEIGAAFERITLAGAKMGASPEDSRHREQMDMQRKIAEAAEGTRIAVERSRPAVSR